ncbi:MAG: 50S ribosomal protein L17 [Acidobacteria bacterium]|nr:50S ribosomal protein L17 [Acidobacteriota bacterium]
MRHRKKYSKLGLTTNQRKALLKGLTISLLEHGAIVTTKARAKQLRSYVERIITKVKKEDEAHARRLVFKKLQSKEAVKKLFDEYKDEFVNRQGGYTRIHLLANRAGDAAEMARISLILSAPVEAEVEVETEKTEKPETKAEKPAKKAKKAEAKPAKIETPVETKTESKTTENETKAEEPTKKTEKAAAEAKVKAEKPTKKPAEKPKKKAKEKINPVVNDQKAE